MRAPAHKHPTERTLYWRHMNVRRMIAAWSGAGADRRHRARRQPGPDHPLHQAGPARHRRARRWPTRSSAAPQAEADRASCEGAAPSTTWRRSSASRSSIAASATRRSRTGRSRSNEFVNTWSIEGFREEGTTTAEMGWGTHEKELPALAYEHTDGPQEPDLPRAHGHQHLGRDLGAARLPHRRHGRPPRRGLHHLRQADRVGGRQSRLPPDGALRLLPVRLGHRVAQRAARLRLRAAAAHPDHETTRSPAAPTSSARW